jgi:hypothetical protein
MDPREFETPEDAREFMMINSLTESQRSRAGDRQAFSRVSAAGTHRWSAVAATHDR